MHTALVNIEKDIRLEERRQPQSGLQSWAASGDTADADVQTDDTGFITVEVLLEEKRQFGQVTESARACS